MRLYGTVTEAAGQHRWKVKLDVAEEEKIFSRGQLRLEEAGTGEVDGNEDEEGYDPGEATADGEVQNEQQEVIVNDIKWKYILNVGMEANKDNAAAVKRRPASCFKTDLGYV